MHNDCYWFIKEEENQEPYMAACCISCGEKQNVGWFWEGSKKGYGDYDLSCEFCKKVIHNKYEETQTSS